MGSDRKIKKHHLIFLKYLKYNVYSLVNGRLQLAIILAKDISPTVNNFIMIIIIISPFEESRMKRSFHLFREKFYSTKQFFKEDYILWCLKIVVFSSL